MLTTTACMEKGHCMGRRVVCSPPVLCVMHANVGGAVVGTIRPHGFLDAMNVGKLCLAC
jgi:hypothetical protein